MAIRVTTYVHATCVALRAGRSWRGVLLRGPSGAGKSDLALRLVEGGGRLVADAIARQLEVAELVLTGIDEVIPA